MHFSAGALIAIVGGKERHQTNFVTFYLFLFSGFISKAVTDNYDVYEDDENPLLIDFLF